MRRQSNGLPELSFKHVRTLKAPGTFDSALGIAWIAHIGQVDKGGETYIMHPIRVAQTVWHLGPEHRTVAILHDVLEDSSTLLINLCDEFSPAIIASLDAITKRKGEAYADYLARVAADPIAKAVKLADLADNMDPRRRFPGIKYALRMAKYRMATAELRGAA